MAVFTVELPIATDDVFTVVLPTDKVSPVILVSPVEKLVELTVEFTVVLPTDKSLNPEIVFTINSDSMLLPPLLQYRLLMYYQNQ